MLAYAERDPKVVALSALQMASALTSELRQVPLVWLGGHNHLSTILSMGTADDELGSAIVGFIDRVIRNEDATSRSRRA